MSDDSVHVAVGVIHGLDNHILLACRPEEKHMGGFWEFPGGKVNEGEDITEALVRELEEELGITPVAFEPLICIKHSYPEKTVILHVYHVLAFSGEPEGREGQEIEWVKPGKLANYTFPPANQAILSAISLPDQYAITGDFDSHDELIEKVSGQLEKGIRLIQFRANHLGSEIYIEYARELTVLCHQFGGKLLIKDSIDLLKENWCDGTHLRAKTALALHKKGWVHRKLGGGHKKWLAVSCHNLSEVRVAEAIGAHFVTLSPICITPTHLEAVPLGFSLAAQLTEEAVLPVYWLGGMHLKSIERVRAAKGQGIAAITAFWPE